MGSLSTQCGERARRCYTREVMPEIPDLEVKRESEPQTRIQMISAFEDLRDRVIDGDKTLKSLNSALKKALFANYTLAVPRFSNISLIDQILEFSLVDFGQIDTDGEAGDGSNIMVMMVSEVVYRSTIDLDTQQLP